MITPNKSEYEEALRKVKKYEDRQQVLSKLNSELGNCLERFSDFKFDVDTNTRTVYFSGILVENIVNETEDSITFGTNNKLVTAKSISQYGNKFEEIIGKLISVKKALNEDYEYIYKYIETYLISSGVRSFVQGGLVYDPDHSF